MSYYVKAGSNYWPYGEPVKLWYRGMHRGDRELAESFAQAYLSATAWTRVQNCTHYKNSEVRHSVELNSKLSVRKMNAKLINKR